MKNSHIVQDNLRLKIADEKKIELIKRWGIGEANLIIAVAERSAKDGVPRKSDPSEIADLVSKNFHIDPTHMTERDLIKYLDRLAELAENEIISREI